MKRLFVINKFAGTGEHLEWLVSQIDKYFPDSERYFTQPKSGALYYPRQWAEQFSEPVQIFACGGDGTLNEVVNSCYGLDHVSVGIIPIGTGNDFCKMFGGIEVARTFENYYEPKIIEVDLLDVNGRKCINATNIGFDALVGERMSKYRKSKLFGGRNAYSRAVVSSIFHRMNQFATIYLDGKLFHEGKFLLAVQGNGRWCGGKYLSCPDADLHDGLFDLTFIKKISRWKLITHIKYFQRGQLADNKRAQKISRLAKAKHLELEFEKPSVYVIDGEMFYGKIVTVQIDPKRVKFIAPNPKED